MLVVSNMEHYNYNHNKLGVLDVSIRPNTRSIRAYVKVDGIHLHIPNKRFLKNGIEFIDSKQDQLLNMLERVKSRQKANITKEEEFELQNIAKETFPKRVKELAIQYGFKYADVSIRKMKSRWGSCSLKGNIHLSSYLAALPTACIDYVILHELCHTRHMNHGPLFWREVEKVCPDYKNTRKIMRQHKWNG